MTQTYICDLMDFPHRHNYDLHGGISSDLLTEDAEDAEDPRKIASLANDTQGTLERRG